MHDRPGVGAQLRAARVARGLSLADLHARTKISARFLAALEDEAFDELPPPPYTCGYVRAVARELGLDGDALAAAVRVAMQPRGGGLGHPVRSPLVPARLRSRSRRMLTTAATVAALAVVAFVAYFGHQLRELGGPEPSVEGGVPSTVQSTPAGPRRDAPSGAGVAARPAVQQPADTGATADQGVVIEVQALGRSWILVSNTTGRLFEGFVTAGETRRWQSDGPVTLRVGNAAAVVLVVNGRPLGPLGRPGEVVSRTFGREPLP
ncbi:MAG: helix-turn-helix domain-containing protein [Armatimonadota bacterium]|nr:helix-turn-helix domain-containing protein [Armatimonadota bacterium]